MLIDLYKSRTDQAGMTARGFLPTAPRGFGDAVGAAFDAATAPDEWGRTAQFRRKQYDEAVAAYEKRTGNKLVSPSLYETDRARAISDLGATGPDLGAALEKHRAEVDRALAEAHKQFADVPDPAVFDQAIADESVRRRDLEARVSETSGFGGKTGLFVGGMAGEMTHPVQVMTLPFGGVGGGAAKSVVGRLALSAAEQSAIAGGTQAVLEAGDYANRKKFGTQQTLSEAASNIALAAAGGALFDAAFKAGPRVIGAGSRAVAAQGRSVLDRFSRAPRAGLDAVNVAESDAFTMASAGRPADMTKHAESLAEAVRSVDQGVSAPAGGGATVPSYGEAPRIPPAAAGFPSVTSDAQGMLTPVKQVVKADVGLPISESLQGVNRVFTASGRGVDVEYGVVEARNLITSHGADMVENPAFPAELQPRDRTRLASQDQISSMAARLQPERLAGGSDAATGAPIVGPDSVVESGNGRVLALQQAYRRFPEKAREYRQHLETLGFDAGHMSEPVLVRRRATALTPEARIAFTREANEAAVMSMGAGEQAFADAKRIPNGILELYRGGDLDLVRNRQFARKVVEAMPASERAAMWTADGELSQAGVKRIEGALLAKAYGNPGLIAKLTEATENDIRAIGRALTEVAPVWAQMRERAQSGQIAAGMDATADLLSAVKAVERSRETGVSVADMLAQGDLLGQGMTEPAQGFLRLMFKGGPSKEIAEHQSELVARFATEMSDSLRAALTKAGKSPDEIDDVVEESARSLDAAAKNKARNIFQQNELQNRLAGFRNPAPQSLIAERLKQYLDEANKTTPGPDMFGAPPLTAGEVLGAKPHTVQTTPEPLASKAAEGAEVASAIDTELARVLEADDLQIPVEVVEVNGQRQVKTRSARELVAEAKAQVKAARQVAMCAAGKLIEAAE